ncbi:MAG: BlaI/MecI/CopY family transcriptional regulator, partial [Verrucomicrobiales bacterium]|nr:BlaI/MecI/CopY family transcriptional regulator [Verrucomicrobiales bacterium]
KVSKDAKQHVYAPAQSAKRAGKSALQRVMSTFFGGSPGNLVAHLLDPTERKLPPEELAKIKALLEAHEGRNRRP